jgi:hypothetical protein
MANVQTSHTFYFFIERNRALIFVVLFLPPFFLPRFETHVHTAVNLITRFSRCIIVFVCVIFYLEFDMFKEI